MRDYQYHAIEEFTMGDVCEAPLTVSSSAFNAFIQASSDQHPLHTNQYFAAANGYGGVILHGMCIASRCSALIAQHIVGSHGLLVNFTADFRRPARPDQPMRWLAQIDRVTPEAKTVEVSWRVTDSAGNTIQRGTACAWLGLRGE